nr:phage minor capsid protein [Olegusella massiliensis]
MSAATTSRTMNICDGAGCKFVEVSFHTGTRPSHADWQGRIYSLTGATVIDGEEIADFYEATGYEGKTGTHASLADRLGGVNCRHSFAPWMPGMGHTYSTTPDEDAGWNREEVYKDMQKQRALEADIRKNKRIAANEEATELEKAEAKAKIWNDQKKLRKLISSKPWLRRDASREKAPELDVQPRGAKSKEKQKEVLPEGYGRIKHVGIYKTTG